MSLWRSYSGADWRSLRRPGRDDSGAAKPNETMATEAGLASNTADIENG